MKNQTTINAHDYQSRVLAWCIHCFGNEVALSLPIRNFRFLEEALELVQATGCTKLEVLKLVDYVYGRPIGEVKQEVGGVMVTLSSLCSAQRIDMSECAEVELARVWTKVDQIRTKQATKLAPYPLPVISNSAPSK